MQDLSCYPSVVAPLDGGHPPPFPLGGSFFGGNFLEDFRLGSRWCSDRAGMLFWSFPEFSVRFVALRCFGGGLYAVARLGERLEICEGMIVAWNDVVDVGGGAVAVGVVFGGLALVAVAVEGRGAAVRPVVGESGGAGGAIPGHGASPPGRLVAGVEARS